MGVELGDNGEAKVFGLSCSLKTLTRFKCLLSTVKDVVSDHLRKSIMAKFEGMVLTWNSFFAGRPKGLNKNS